MTNLGHQTILILLLTTSLTHSDVDEEFPNVTTLAPCTSSSGTANCSNGGGFENNIPTEMPDNSTDALPADPFGISTADPYGQNELQPAEVDILLEQPDAQAYFASFEDEFQRLLVKETFRYCPYSDLCNFTLNQDYESLITYDERLCCGTCSCQPDCTLLGNCCPDYHGIMSSTTDTRVLETCMKTFVQGAVITRRFPFSIYKHKVRAYQECPEATDSSLESLCSGDYSLLSNITVDDVLPVSDPVSMKTYKNRHCVACNGVNTSAVTQWGIKIRCLLQEPFEDVDELVSGVILGDRACRIDFVPPSSIDVRNCSQITACNETGLWMNYDLQTDRACGFYKTEIAVLKEFAFNYIYFMNPFCAICNGLTPNNHICYNLYPFDPSIPYAFSGLLRLNSRNEQNPSTEAVCGPGSMFNDVKRRCESVACPHYHTFMNGGCEPYFDTTETLGYRVFAILRSSLDVSLQDAYSLMPALISSFEEVIASFEIGIVCNKQTTIILKENHSQASPSAMVDSFEFLYDVVPNLDQFGQLPPNATSLAQTVQLLLGLVDMYMTIDTGSGSSILFNIILRDDTRSFNTRTPYTQYNNWALRGTPLPLQDLIFLNFIDNSRVNVPYFLWNERPGTNVCAFIGRVVRILTMRPCPMFSVDLIEFGLIDTPSGLMFEKGDNPVVGVSDYAIEDNSSFVVRMCVETYRHAFQNANTPERISDDVIESIELVVSIASVSVSIACLVITFVVYWCLSELQTFPGRNNMALIVSLLLAQSTYLLGSYGKLDTDFIPCKLVGGLTHFFWLCSVFWMHVCTFHMFNVLVKMRPMPGTFFMGRFLQYHTYCITLSVTFVCINIVVSMVTGDFTDVGYGKSSCYVSTQRMIELTFGLPAALVVISNLAMFITIIVKLSRRPDVSPSLKHERNYSIVFAKLSTITGVTWLFGFVYMWTGITAFSFAFIILNGSQGLFLMLSFVCNSRTMAMLKVKLRVNFGCGCIW